MPWWTTRAPGARRLDSRWSILSRREGRWMRPLISVLVGFLGGEMALTYTVIRLGYDLRRTIVSYRDGMLTRNGLRLYCIHYAVLNATFYGIVFCAAIRRPALRRFRYSVDGLRAAYWLRTRALPKCLLA
jgi:hypothetical protein